MAWFGPSSEWKQGLSSMILGKVEELENMNEKLKREKNQKQTQLDTLQQALEKQKRKTDEEVKQRQAFEKETEQLSRACEQLQEKLRGVSDHNSSVSQLMHNSTIIIDAGPEKLKQRKIEELESENRILQEKINKFSCKDPIIQTPVKASNRDDFWSHFSQPQTSLPQNTPHKVSMKKALETSEENPFKAPPVTPFKKEMKSNGASSNSTADYALVKDSNRLDVDCLAIKTTADNKISEITSFNEQHTTIKFQTEDASLMLERSEQKLKHLQTELECQRHNTETLKKRLDEVVKEKEREFNIEASRFQTEIAAADKKIRELSIKLQQQETLAMNTQNILQASLDKIKLQLTSSEKDKILIQNRCGQLETSVSQYEKGEEDRKKLICQLKQEKEMISSQVESLKVKLSGSDSQVNRLQLQLEKAEQLCIQQMESLEDALELKKSIEKERASFNQSVEEFQNKVEEVDNLKAKLSESSTQNNELQVQLKNTEMLCTQHKTSLEEAVENYQSLQKEKNSFRHSAEEFKNKEEEAETLKVKLTESTLKLNSLRVQLENSERLCIQSKASLEVADENKKSLEMERNSVLHKIETLRNIEEKCLQLEKSTAIAQEHEEKAREEKLAAELSVWELEGKLDGLKKDLENSSNEKKLLIEIKSQEKQELQKQVFNLEDTIFERNSSISSLETQIAELKKKCEDFNDVVKSLNITKEESQAAIKSQKEKLNEAEANNAELENTLLHKKAILNKLTLELEAKFKIIAEMSVNFENKSKEKEEAKIQIEAVYKETTIKNNVLKDEIDKISKVLGESKRNYNLHISDLQSVKLQCEYEVERLKSVVAELSAKFDEAKLKDQVNLDLIINLNKKLDTKQIIIAQLNCNVEGFQLEITQLNTEKEEMLNKINNLNFELTNASDLNKILENQLTEKDSIMHDNDSIIESIRQQNTNLLNQGKVSRDINLEQATCLQQFVDELEDMKIEKETIECLNKELQKNNDEFYLQYETIVIKLKDADNKLQKEQATVNNKISHILSLTTEMNELKEKNNFTNEQIKELELISSEMKVQNQTLCIDKENLAREMYAMNERFPDLENKLKLKENELAETQRGILEIREEFDKKIKEMNENISELENQLLAKENYLTQLESKCYDASEKSKECEGQLSKEQKTARDILIKFECYKEVVKLMERETMSDNSVDDSKIRSENEALLDKVKDFSFTINNQGKVILDLQKMNMELKAKLNCSHSRHQDVDVQTDDSLYFHELPTEQNATEEKKEIQSQLNYLLQKILKLELNCEECKQSLQSKCAEFEEIQNSNAELLNRLTQKEQEIIILNKKIECQINGYNELLVNFNKLSEDLKLELINHQNIFSKMEESQKSIERYKLDVAGLKAKFSLNQRSIAQKDKEIEQSLKINLSFKDTIHKLKEQINEDKNKKNQLYKELSLLRDTLKGKEMELVKITNLYEEVMSKLNETETNNQNVKQKFSKLQMQNKKFQIMVSKQKRNTLLNAGAVNKETENSVRKVVVHLPEQQSSGEVVGCSQSSGEQLPKSIALLGPFPINVRGRKSYGRRKTTGNLISPTNKAGKEKSGLKILSPNVEVDQDHLSNRPISVTTADSVLKLDPFPENFSATLRRVTRLSSSRESVGSDSYVESGKRSLLSPDSINPKRQKLTIKNSNVEGLPCKTEKGLNDIPIGVESPGIMRRSTASSLQKMNVAQMSPRGPLRLRDTNYSLVHPTPRSNME